MGLEGVRRLQQSTMPGAAGCVPFGERELRSADVRFCATFPALSRHDPPPRANARPPSRQRARPPWRARSSSRIGCTSASVTPPPPLLRDPGTRDVLAVLVALARAWGPARRTGREDFDFLQRALFGKFTLLDGGGSTSFWRPIPHQLYYLAFARVMLEHPPVMAGIHSVLLALASLLFYRAFRTARPGPWAAVVATAPLLSESTRLIIGFPSDFVDVGLWLFVALAAHETAKRRLPTALLALLCALLCKEVAVIAAVLLPLMPGIGPPDHRTRLRWLAAAARSPCVGCCVSRRARTRSPRDAARARADDAGAVCGTG